MDRKWVKVFLSSLDKMSFQVGVKRNLMKTFLSFEHNASYIEDAEQMFFKIQRLIEASNMLLEIKEDMNISFSKLDDTKRRILFLRHRKNMEYNDIAKDVGIKIRSVFYQYNKAVDIILKNLVNIGYTDKLLLDYLNDDSLMIDEFRRNDIREKKAS